jgi:protein subunit release factor A
MLRHEPTGVVVFAHDTRSADENQKIAWERLVIKVGAHARTHVFRQ